MRHLIPIALLVSGAAVGAGLGYKKWKEHEADNIFQAKIVLPTLTRKVNIEPLPFVARIDDRFKCAPSDMGRATTCGDSDWYVIQWTLERETNTDSIAGIVAGAYDESRIAVVDIAGFHGFIDLEDSYRRPITDITFTGWREDPHGRLKLTIYANGWRHNDVIDRPRAIAIMMSTELAPRGMPARIPDGQDISSFDDAAKAIITLQNDRAEPLEWRNAAERYAYVMHERKDTLAEWLAETSPAAVSATERRLRDHARTPDGCARATALADPLFRMDADKGRAAAADLAREIAGAWRFDSPDASAWLETEVRLAALRAAMAKESAPVDEVARRIAPMPRKIVLHEPRATVQALAQAKRGPDGDRLLAAWLDPEGMPPDTNYAALAKALARQRRSSPGVKSHLLAMLARRDAAGTFETKGAQLIVHGQVGDESYYAPWANEGPTVPLRVCDVYAIALKNDDSSLDFTPRGTLTERDAELANIRERVAAP
jgi:hypothetical protein